MAGAEETLNGGAWTERVLAGRGLWLFWGALGAVLVTLLCALRGLPPTPATPD